MNKALRVYLTLGVVAVLAGVAGAQVAYNDIGDGLWTTADNTVWNQLTGYPSAALDTATIDSNTVTLNTDTVAGLAVNLGGGSILVSGSRIIYGPLTVSGVSGLTVNSGQRLDIGNYGSYGSTVDVFRGSGMLNVSGTGGGVVWLAATNNTYSGVMSLDNVRVNVRGNGALGAGTVNVNSGTLIDVNQGQSGATVPQMVNVNNGGTFWTDNGGTTSNWKFTLNSGGTLSLGRANLQGTVAVAGNGLIKKDDQNNNAYFYGALTGGTGQTVQLQGGSSQYLMMRTSSAAYQGSLEIIGGTVRIYDTADALGVNGVGGTVTIGSAGRLLQDTDIPRDITVANGGSWLTNNNSPTYSGVMTTLGTVKVENTGGTTMTASGQITGAGRFIVSGNGTGWFRPNNATNNYTGGLDILTGGGLLLQTAGAAGTPTTGAKTINIAGRLRTNSSGAALLTGYDMINVNQGGVLDINSTEAAATVIHVLDGGTLAINGGLTPEGWGTSIILETGCGVQEAGLVTPPTRAQIVGGGQIFKAFSGNLSGTETVGVDATDPWLGIVTVANDISITGTVNERNAGQGFSVKSGLGRIVTLSGATVNATGTVNLTGKGDFALAGSGWTGTSTAIAVDGDPNATQLFMSAGSVLTAGHTVNVVNGMVNLRSATAMDFGSQVNVNQGAALVVGPVAVAAATGTISVKAGGTFGLQMNDVNGSIADANIEWEEGSILALLLNSLPGVPVGSYPDDGTVSILLTQGLSRNVTLGNNTRLTTMAGGMTSVTGTISTGAGYSSARLAGRNAGFASALRIEGNIDMPGDTLIIGDANPLHTITDVYGGRDSSTPLGDLAQNGAVVLLSGTWNFAALDVTAGKAGLKYAPASMETTIVRAGTQLHLMQDSANIGSNIRGTGTIVVGDGGENEATGLGTMVVVGRRTGDVAGGTHLGGIAPGLSVGTLPITGGLSFSATNYKALPADPDDFEYPRVDIEVVGSGGVAGTHFDQITVSRSANVDNANLAVALSVPSGALRPSTPNWSSPGTPTTVVTRDLGDMAIIATTLGASGAFNAVALSTIGRPADDHWALSFEAGAVLTEVTATNAVLKGANILWMALPGDANLDNAADVSDLSLLAGNFRKTTGQTWLQGDFNFDGAVDVSDLSLLAGRFRQTNPLFPAEGGTPVPEPMTMVLLGLGAVGLLARRRR